MKMALYIDLSICKRPQMNSKRMTNALKSRFARQVHEGAKRFCLQEADVLLVLWVLLLIVLFYFLTARTAEAACSGRIINPVSDICWSCLMPIKVAGTTLSSSGVSDPDTDAPSLCVCQKGPVPQAGINMSFWEPVRTVEIVREPYCFPSLGGLDMNPGNAMPHAAAHGRSASRGKTSEIDSLESTHQSTAFYQAHWYHTPWLFILEVLLDTTCLENAPYDLAYMTELDPIWNDALAAFILAPESALFANPVAVGACMLDCTAATIMQPRAELFWCSGCQGSLYPLSGWIAAMTSPLQAWHLIAARMTVKLAREGLLWAAYGKKGQCGPYFEPIPRKDVWRTQLVHPTVTASGTCCRPLGAPTAVWGAGKTYPVNGEDGAILLWRKRDCCASKNFF